tara:strand:- start:4214 stop:4882 length:669 start_codon:yes stop_codon:yes gene_type:complete
MSESIIVYKANNHLEASSCLSNLIIEDIKSANKNCYSIGLSGGNTPKVTYSMLKNDIEDLSKILFWTVDERWVPIDNENSNQNLINSFFSTSDAQILNVEFTNTSADEDAQAYSKKLQDSISEFDTVILGVGEDGHIASLFPGTKAIQNKDDLYVSNEVNIVTQWRVTATHKLLASAKNVYLLVTGENKKAILKTILDNGTTPANELIKNRKETILITDQSI